MAIIDDTNANVDDFGLITSSEARELSVTNAELVQQERRGKLVRVARGVYRMPVWPYQEAAPYAIAVRATGKNAYLWGSPSSRCSGWRPPILPAYGSPRRPGFEGALETA
ncbi:MAG: type IV toxin-antitoxin system AbiEi family antitoxin domain-containing protein [Atopobiaceae bacterium]|nr:type IV toxin-antitoxin system AbiEi family antitoxin domain-containing protein [Atopobiaceae bacterium]